MISLKYFDSSSKQPCCEHVKQISGENIIAQMFLHTYPKQLTKK